MLQRDLLIREFLNKWCFDLVVNSESGARESKGAPRDRRLRDDKDVDGLDPTVLENWVVSWDNTTATMEHDSSTESHQAPTDWGIDSGRIEDQDTGLAIEAALIRLLWRSEPLSATSAQPYANMHDTRALKHGDLMATHWAHLGCQHPAESDATGR